MNKYKKHLHDLRTYLSRDTRGVELLNEVSRDLTEQRKELAAAKNEKLRAENLLHKMRKEMLYVKEEQEKTKKRLEAETARHASTKLLQQRLADRIAAIEKENNVEEEVPVERGATRDDERARKIAALLASVRRICKRIPDGYKGGPCIRLETFIQKFTVQEFEQLGRVVAALALVNLPFRVEAEVTIRELGGADKFGNKHLAKFLKWLQPWMQMSAIEDKLYGGVGPWHGKISETTVFTQRKAVQ
jgi:hypothetical protein